MRVPLIVISVILILIGLKLFTTISGQILMENGSIQLTLPVIITSIGVLLLIGCGVGALWSYKGESIGENEIKFVGGGVLGVTAFVGFCLGGTCFSAACLSAFLGGIYQLIMLVPVMIGTKLGSMFSFKR